MCIGKSNILVGPLFAVLSTGFAIGSFDCSARAQDASERFYSKRTDWDQPSGDGVNISSFVFRDLNLDSVYNLGDKPMAAIAFELSGQGRQPEIFRSNISGVANYKMSATLKDHDITEPGLYQARIIIPPGWFTTTKDAESQVVAFESFPGAPADMVARKPLRPVGLAPKLSISGHIKDAKDPAATIQLRITSPKNETQDVVIGPDGSFNASAERGQWTLRATNPATGAQVERVVEVGQAPVYLSTIELVRQDPSRLPMRRVTNFDTLINSGAIAEIPNGYDGIDWQYFVVTHNRNYAGEGYINNTMSGEYLAYNASGHPIAIESKTGIDFVGGYFGLAWLNSEGEIVTVRAWRQDKVAYEDEFELSSLGPVRFDADYRGVTRVEFATKHFWQFVFDDLEFGFAK